MQRKYTLDQLRSMLKGKRWCDFRRYRTYYKDHQLQQVRTFNVGQVFFTLRLIKFMLRPTIQITCQGHVLVCQVISPQLFDEFKRDFHNRLKWRSVYTGNVINYEPEESAT